MSSFFEEEPLPGTWEAPGGFSPEVPDCSGFEKRTLPACGKSVRGAVNPPSVDSGIQDEFQEEFSGPSVGEAVNPPLIGTWESSNGFPCSME